MPEGTESGIEQDPIEINAQARLVTRFKVNFKFVIEFVDGEPRLKLFETLTPSSEESNPIFHFEIDSMGIGYLYGILSSAWKQSEIYREIPSYDSHGNPVTVLVYNPDTERDPEIHYTDSAGITYEIKTDRSIIVHLQIALHNILFPKTETPPEEEGEPTNG